MILIKSEPSKRGQYHWMLKSFIFHLHSSSLNFPLLLSPSIDCVGKSTILLATETTSCVWEAGGSPGEYASTSLSQFQSLTRSFILDTNARRLPQQQQDGTWWVISYGHCTLSEHGKNYYTTWLEMLTVVTYINFLIPIFNRVDVLFMNWPSLILMVGIL